MKQIYTPHQNPCVLDPIGPDDEMVGAKDSDQVRQKWEMYAGYSVMISRHKTCAKYPPSCIYWL